MVQSARTVTSNYWVTSLNFCNNKLVRSISLKVFYSITNINLPLLHIFGAHPSVSPILLLFIIFAPKHMMSTHRNHLIDITPISYDLL